MQNLNGATFNACFYILMSKLWMSGQIPNNIIEDDDTAKLFIARTMDAIGFLSKTEIPEAYKSLYMKSYKDENGAFLFIQLPDALKDSDSKLVLMMNVSGTKKFYTVEKFGNQFLMCEYTESSKSTTGFMIEDFNDSLELYSQFTGRSNDFVS